MARGDYDTARRLDDRAAAQGGPGRPSAIEVLEVRRVNGRGSLKAFAKVRLGCITIDSCRIIQQPGGDPWLALPQLPVRRRPGGRSADWAPMVEITNPAVLVQLREAVLAVWRERAP
jgi:hypothetical protein